jgi:hypothetical protein
MEAVITASGDDGLAKAGEVDKMEALEKQKRQSSCLLHFKSQD